MRGGKLPVPKKDPGTSDRAGRLVRVDDIAEGVLRRPPAALEAEAVVVPQVGPAPAGPAPAILVAHELVPGVEGRGVPGVADAGLVHRAGGSGVMLAGHAGVILAPVGPVALLLRWVVPGLWRGAVLPGDGVVSFMDLTA